MIKEWRRVWSDNSGTSSNFPFGFMQLSTWTANDLDPGFSVIRWYQTASYGYVPNDVLQVCLFMSINTQ